MNAILEITALRVGPIVLAGLALGLGRIRAASPLDDSENSGFFVRLGGRILTGLKAEIRDHWAPGATGVYDDGFVKADISGGGDTWNWGYTATSPLSGNQLTLHRNDDVPRVGNRTGLGGNPLFGGEIVGGLEFARFDVGRRQMRFGLELGYGYTSGFSVAENAGAAARATRTTAVFDLGGIIPPAVGAGAPYSGTFQGPGPVIDLNPVSTVQVQADGISHFDASLESTLHTFKFGPWIELPLTSRLTLGLSAGYCSVYADTDFRFTDTVTYAAGAIPNSTVTDRVRQGDWSPGGYADLRLGCEFNRHWSAFVGGGLQYNGPRTFSDAEREVKLEFGVTFGGTVGMTFKF